MIHQTSSKTGRPRDETLQNRAVRATRIARGEPGEMFVLLSALAVVLASLATPAARLTATVPDAVGVTVKV